MRAERAFAREVAALPRKIKVQLNDSVNWSEDGAFFYHEFLLLAHQWAIIAKLLSLGGWGETSPGYDSSNVPRSPSV